METPAATFREAGTGTGVVCIHASASSSGQWRPLMDRLADRFHVLAPDLYGYGPSGALAADRELSMPEQLALLEPVFRAAGDRFHLIGHSYGGALALRAALDNPGRLRSLILFEPVLFAVLLQEDPEQPAAREISSVRDDTNASAARGDLAQAAERFIDYWMGAGAWANTPDKRRPAVINAMRKLTPEWNAVFHEPTPLAAFSRLAVETLYLVGTESPAASRGVARLLTRTLPNVTVVEIPGVGHMGPVTHPAQINAAIEAHLDRIASAPA
jgi:pimeloyl-ACP methyl ester carboxylesterase